MDYNTNNPVGSTDPRDLYDNAANADRAVNGQEVEWTDRLGKARKSWAGMEKMVGDFLVAQGYESVFVIYAAGAVVERQTQLVQRDGELYRVKLAADIPLGLTGNWAVDAPKLQAVGDAFLRSILQGANGSNFVGHEGGTVRSALLDLDVRLDDAAEALAITTMALKNARALTAAHNKMRSGQALRICCQGDSMTAGYDVSSADKVPADNGDWATHAAVTYPAALRYLLGLSTGTVHTVLNQGYSGDTAKQSYNRWTVNPNVDVVHLMLGINDAGGVAGANFEEYTQYMELLIQRFISWGAGVVLHTTTPQLNSTATGGARFGQAIRALASAYKCPVFESDTVVLYSRQAGVYSDSTHFNTQGYNKYGNAVAAFIMALLRAALRVNWSPSWNGRCSLPMACVAWAGKGKSTGCRPTIPSSTATWMLQAPGR